ncbi:MAG: MFS transporter [Alphaproteobacteria bacterium]|nr:MFS transporter [Alphaproteobacteria bacterium]
MSPGDSRDGGFARVVLTCFLPFAAGYLLSYIFRTVNAVVGPRLAAELQIDIAALGVLTSAYFAGFVLLQIPAGVLLDRYGPRRVQAVLLVFAAIGALLFSQATTLAGLALARGLIGVGVATCLMAGFKANTLFWPPERLGTANGVLMAFAGVGGAVGTLPVTWLADAVGWRGVFHVLTACALVLAAIVWRIVPDRRPATVSGLGEALDGVRRIFTARAFWAVVPLSAFTQSVFQAYHTLWTAPWLVDVAGFAPAEVPVAMLLVLLGIIPGYLLSGAVTDALGRRGVDKGTLFAVYTGAFILLQAGLALGPSRGAVALWVLYVVLGTGSVIAYVILTPLFPRDLAGRLNTAINLVVFLVAFLIQASIGHALVWVEHGFAVTRAGAHGVVLAALVALQGAMWLWFVAGRRRA